MLINTSRLTGVRIDASARIVRAGAATKWEHVVPQLSELGLAALHGSAPDVGIVGYSLGGGIGWLARGHGLQCNSVTAIEFAVYPISAIYAGALFFPYERASKILRAWRDSLPAMPDKMTTWCSILHLPDLPFVPEPVRGGSFAVVMGAFTGTETAGRELLADLRGRGPLIDTFAVVAPAGISELAMDPPAPLPYQCAHAIVGDLSDEAIHALVQASGPQSGLAAVQLRHLGGALQRRPERAGARADLPGHIMAFAVGMVTDEPSVEVLGRSLSVVRTVLSTEHTGRYASFVEEPADASTFYDPATWARLRAIPFGQSRQRQTVRQLLALRVRQRGQLHPVRVLATANFSLVGR